MDKYQWRAAVWGLTASLGLTLFYLIVLRFSSGSWLHVITEIERLWYWLGLLAVGFGLQVWLVFRLRHHTQHRLAANSAGIMGTGTSTGAMLACCAHHLAEVLPFIGLSGLAVLLIRYQLSLIVVGLVVNLLSIIYLWRKLSQCTYSAVATP
ncbi:MAG: hypothetical protein HY974_04750 [Candidatus Kerfeldbacteria bacterium]|nr:hypothetical protein [Candidatus Kerfeldbacteria bacterium]